MSGGRKRKYTDLEDELLLWKKWEQGLQVSCNIIIAKAKGRYDEKADGTRLKPFVMCTAAKRECAVLNEQQLYHQQQS